MPTITADRNLLIEFDEVRWHMRLPQLASDMLVIEATSGGIAYHAKFGAARRLPAAGVLLSEDVTDVLVGWSADDSAWHVGLLLSDSLSSGRNSRWVELASWPANQEADADAAGSALARVLSKPYRLITAEESAQSKRTASARSLPLTFGEWRVSEEFSGLQWSRTPQWRNDMLLRSLFFLALTPLFGVLSIGALTSPYARVQPEWLPLVGIALALIMLYSALMSLRAILRSPVTLIDTRLSIMRQSRRGSQKMVQSPFEGLQYALISHTVSRRQAMPAVPDRDFAVFEVWVHLASTRRGFIEVCHSENVEGEIARGVTIDTRRPFDSAVIDSPAHYAALRTAQAIGVPVFVEAR
jgi:hypothetical protein